MGMICNQHDKEMKLIDVIDRIGGKHTAIYKCPECKKNTHIKSEDWEYTEKQLSMEV